MANKYRSVEDYKRESAELDAAMSTRKGVVGVETQLTGALETSGAALEDNATKTRRNAEETRLRNKAKQEAADLEKRAANVHVEDAKAMDLDTAAIQRNAEAMRRAAQARANLSGAFRGARDPLFAQAVGLNDPITGVTSGRLRRELGIGTQRADRMRDAIGLGITPGSPGITHGPVTAMQDAERELNAAQKAKRAALNKGTEAEQIDADAALKSAQARMAQLKSLEENKVATDANTVAVADATKIAHGVTPGMELVKRPPAWQRADSGGRSFGAAPAATVPSGTTTRPVMDELPLRVGGGDPLYDHNYLQSIQDAEKKVRLLEQARNDEAAAARAALHVKTVEDMQGQAVAAERTAKAVRFSSVELATASQQMTRHGALTSEFIQAAARGETTLREIGNQALVTAGKFGAWSLAAAGIYGVVAALNKVREGAVETGTGVAQLRRFIPNVDPQQAAQGFRDTAQNVNVPVKDVAEAQAQFARIYHDQGDSLKAARAALLATKLDNISTADSFNYLTAGARGFNLHAKDMVPLLAQINAGQNILGARVAETIPAFGKSAAAIKNAGGDLNQFLAIIFTMQRATGISGSSISTVLSRSATNFIHKPQNVETLKSFGLDPNEGYTQLITDAVARAQHLNPDQIRQLAAALGGPQLGSRGFVGLLTRPDILQQANAALGDPAANQRLLEHERRQVVDSPSQEIAKIGVNLSRIGSALSGSGLTAGPFELLKLLNGTLNVGVHIIEIFDKLPQPFKDALSIATELFVVMKLIQRFGGKVPVLGALSPNARDASLIRRGANDAVQAAKDDRERLTQQFNRATLASNRGRSQLTEFDRANAAVLNGPDTPERAELERKRATLLAATERQETRMLELEMEINASLEEVRNATRIQAELKQAQIKGGKAGVVQYGIQNELFQAQTHDVPSDLGAVPAGAMQNGAAAAAAGAGVTAGGATKMAAAETEVTKELGNAERALTGLGTSGVLLGRGADSGWSATRRATERLKNTGGGLKRLWLSMSEFTAGPLDILIGAFTGFEIVKGAIDNAVNRANDQMAAMNKVDPGSDPRPSQAVLNRSVGPLGWAQNAFADAGNFLIGAVGGGHPLATPDQVARQQANANMRLYNHVVQEQQKGRLLFLTQIDQQLQQNLSPTSPTSLLGMPQLQSMGGDDVFDANGRPVRGAGTGFGALGPMNQMPSLMSMRNPKAMAAAATKNATDRTNRINDYKDAIDQIENGYAMIMGSPGAKAAAQAQIKRYKDAIFIQRHGGNQLAGDLAAMSPADFQKETKGDADALAAYQQAFGTLQRSSLHRLNTAYDVAKKLADAHPTKENLAKLSSAVSALDQVGQGIVKDFQDDMTLAQNAHDRHAAFQKAMGELNKLPKGRERDLMKRQVADASYQADEQARQTQLAYLQSQTTDRSVQDSEAINSAAAGVREAARRYGQGSDQWKQAMTTLNNARHQNAQDIQADITGEIESQNALITARASGDPSGRSEAIAAVTTAQRSLQAVLNDKTLKGRARTAAINNANAAVITAQLALNNYYKDQAAAMTQARYTLRESLTDDPVKRAQIEADAARAAIKDAKTPADRITAQANYNDKMRAVRDAKLQSSEDTVDWELQMGKISKDTAIAEYEAILKGHKMSKEARRQLQLRIHQLEQEANNDASSFDLQVGAGIKLPTIYDVRRSIKQARRAGDQGAITANNKIDVNVQVNDPNAAGAVFEAIDQAMGTSVNTTMRQAGVI